MSQNPSAGIRLYGTDEPPQSTTELHAGALSVILQSGNLRYISIGGREAIRAISFVVRDKDWGTYNPTISNLDLQASEAGFRIRYDARCSGNGQVLDFSATIEGADDGSLSFVVTGFAGTPFLTSRTGFVVLHPIAATAGQPVAVTHTDGTTEQNSFPDQISPSQPFMDIRSLRHEVSPGTYVNCTMTGDAFEMEDQRNWSDASFKTYICPLSRPTPYTLEPGSEILQRVDLVFEGGGIEPVDVASDETVNVRVHNDVSGELPELALAVHPDFLDEALAAAELVRRSNVSRLFCTFDTSRGHDASTMRRFRRLAELTGASLILEGVLPLCDREGNFSGDADVLESDVAGIRNAADDAGAKFSMISASPACYLKSYQPSGPWPSAPPLDLVYDNIRDAFPGVAVAAGMHSYFTEFNRHRPPVAAADAITHSTSPLVHAGDDLSVMETLQALPSIFASAREIGAGKPYWIGPTAIGMRFNPYGSTTMPNPDNIRAAMVTVDPRQRGLFNAAWTLGYISRAAAGRVDGLCLSAVAGPFGVAWHKAQWRQPWFDELDAGNAVFPVYHVIAGLAGKSGSAVRSVDCSRPEQVAALAFGSGEGMELWLANLSATGLQVEISGIGAGFEMQRLDDETFERCCLERDGFVGTITSLHGPVVQLGPFAVARIVTPKSGRR